MQDSHELPPGDPSLSSLGQQSQEGAYLMRLFQTAERINASDIHLMLGETPYFRVPGGLASRKGPGLADGHVELIMGCTLNDERRKAYHNRGYVDYAHEDVIPVRENESHRVRYRIQLYKTRGSMAAAIRRIKLEIPSFEELHLPPVYEAAIRRRPKGIIVVGGETGSGKSTTLAAMVSYINAREMKHVVTIEDPIEYIIANDQSRINQREMGQDFPTYAEALRAVVRQDPDVIVIGEMRDAETVRTAITAAETGHLVLTSLHTAEVVQTFYRILNFFGEAEKEAVRKNLSTTLIAIMNQMLLPSIKKDVSRVPATEVLINNAAVKMYIERGEESKLEDIIESGEDGMRSFNFSLHELHRTEHIDRATALKASLHPEKLRTLLTFEGGIKAKD
ncbi:MAG TPA: type IV pili twitching motility protein PilT [Planctomycetaceae bacterium]|nr:type IV pili twitching motility protein PilT [Planctomycetaceae bacterium]